MIKEMFFNVETFPYSQIHLFACNEKAGPN